MAAMLHRELRDNAESTPAPGEFLVVCLCAEWCGVCREYRSGFEEVARQFPDAGFCWLDIESHADEVGDLDVDNFPTLVIKRRDWVLFYGAMLPSPDPLLRILRVFLQQTPEQSREYAFSSVERRGWQQEEDLQRLGPDKVERRLS
jgi:thiol-disulfide isomerase/thioredoxin